MWVQRSAFIKAAIVLGAVILFIIASALTANRSALRYISNFALNGRAADSLVWADGLTNQYANFVRMQESVSGVRVSSGNQVKILIDGPSTYVAMLEAINAARNHINLETYILENGVVGEQFSKALKQKAQAGVQVNLLYDYFGSFLLDGDYLDAMRDAGVNIRSFQGIVDVRFWRFNQRDHRKMLIVDGEIGFIGGINISDSYLHAPQSKKEGTKTAWHDVHARIEGPAVRNMQELFLAAWLNHGSTASPKIDYFPESPNSLPSSYNVAASIMATERLDAESRILETFIGAIQAANRKIWITQAYFVPHFEFVQSLIDAAQRGVDVRVILPKKSDSNLVIAASHAHFNTLLEGGVRIYRYESNVLHSKTAVVDGLWSTIGSSNVDMRSLEHNNEANLVVIDAGFASELEALFKADIEHSTEVDLGVWRTRSYWNIAQERSALLLAYWL